MTHRYTWYMYTYTPVCTTYYLYIPVHVPDIRLICTPVGLCFRYQGYILYVYFYTYMYRVHVHVTIKKYIRVPYRPIAIDLVASSTCMYYV